MEQVCNRIPSWGLIPNKMTQKELNTLVSSCSEVKVNEKRETRLEIWKRIFGDIPHSPKSITINSTLITLYYQLNHIYRFPVGTEFSQIRELTDETKTDLEDYQDWWLGVFYVGNQDDKTKLKLQCYFTQDKVFGMRLHYKQLPMTPNNTLGRFCRVPDYKTELDLRKSSIFLCQTILSSFGTETGIEDYSQMMERFHHEDIIRDNLGDKKWI